MPERSPLAPLAAAHLPALQRLLGPAHTPRLRWYLHTPYATVLGLLESEAVVAVAGVLRFEAHVHIGLLHDPAHLLLPLLPAHLHAQGTARITVQAPTAWAPRLAALGLLPLVPFRRYTGGRFMNASLNEVVLLEPPHTLALLHQAKHTLGMDLRPLLLEHRFAAHVYAEGAHVRGGLLPLLGHGLLVADAPHVGLELQRWLLPHQPHVVVPTANTAAGEHLTKQGYTAAPAGALYSTQPHPAFRAEQVFAWPWSVE